MIDAIADSGYLLALLNSADRYHSWAMRWRPKLKMPVLTCEAVLTETAYHLKNSAVVIELLNSGFLEVAFVAQKNVLQLAELAGRFFDRRPDFADLCLIRMSELFPTHSILTVDRKDFSIYRRNKNQSIPIICPPQL